MDKDDILNSCIEQYARRFRNMEYYTDKVGYWEWFLSIRDEIKDQVSCENQYDCYFGILEYLRRNEME